MKKRMPTTEEIVKCIRIIQESSDSHLDLCVSSKQACPSCGGKKFHGQTTREYKYVESILSLLLP